MGAVENLSDDMPIQKVDQQFLDLFAVLSNDAIDKAAQCTEQVFNITNEFLSTGASDVLKKFHKLYFGTPDIEARKEEMNRDVDSIVDRAQKSLSQGQEIDPSDESSSDLERLGLSGLQKQLEGLITMDEGIRQKIIPALASMQFEDAVRQRLDHISHIWLSTFKLLSSGGDEKVDFNAFSKELAECLSSVRETESFYRLVVKEEPPNSGMEEGDALLF